MTPDHPNYNIAILILVYFHLKTHTYLLSHTYAHILLSPLYEAKITIYTVQALPLQHNVFVICFH